MQAVVVYYSFEGNVRMLAEKIAQATGAELIELLDLDEPESKGFMKFVKGGARAMLGQKTRLGSLDAARLAKAELVFVGTPVWAFTCTPAVRTFLSEQKLSGKKLAFFCASGGSKGKTFTVMRNLAGPDNTVLGELELVEPLKREPGQCAERISLWAASMVEKAQAVKKEWQT